MSGSFGLRLAALMGGTAMALAACDNGPSAVAPAGRDAPQGFAAVDAPARTGGEDRADRDDGPRVDHRGEPALKVDGEAMWAATRRYSAAEGAQRSFERNGEDFAAADVDAYVRKARAFVSRPPAGVETLKRPNGDVLYYDARANVFAVADKAGLPKTMFKPDEGAAYWREQKDRDARRQTARRSGSAAGGDEG